MMSRKKSQALDDEILLPEPMIHHIQSFLNGKEAARTSILSKSWYRAWLTRPALDFDQECFRNKDPKSSINVKGFAEFAMKTMQRYQGLKLNIKSFRLRMVKYVRTAELFAENLIVKAMELGATDLNIESHTWILLLPREVLLSETLVNFTARCVEIVGDARCWRLKSLSLDSVHLQSDDMIKEMLSCFSSIEELSLSSCSSFQNPVTSDTKRFQLSRMNPCVLPKLRSLFLENMEVDSLFFRYLSSSFPCLKDLSVVRCNGYKRIEIVSSSLERITFVQLNVMAAVLDVPNIRNFTYVGRGLPSLSITPVASREWEFNISLNWSCPQTSLYFQRLKQLLIKFRTSKITLSIGLYPGVSWNTVQEERNAKALIMPVQVETLRVEAPESCSALLVRLFGICRPKFITHSWVPVLSRDYECASDRTLEELCMILMHQEIRLNVFKPDKNLFGRFNLKRVIVKHYEEAPTEWWVLKKKPLDASTAPANKQKVRFQLRWRRLPF